MSETDAELLALKPRFDEIFGEWRQWIEAHDRQDIEDAVLDAFGLNTLYEIIDEVLNYSPVTREGLALQCRAMLMHNYGDWQDLRTAAFVAGVACFLKMKLPDFVTDDLFDAIGRRRGSAKKRAMGRTARDLPNRQK